MSSLRIKNIVKESNNFLCLNPTHHGPLLASKLSSLMVVCVCSVASVVSDSLLSHGLQPGRLLCPWDFPGKNAGVACHFLLEGSSPPRD